MSEELKVAIEAAKEGGKHALKYFEKELEVEFKDDNTPVTKADKESEEVIKKHILKHYPHAKFVGEETGGSVEEDEFWVIDPVDGTRSFSRGIPQWCTLLSLCKKDGPFIGVSYWPVTNEVLYAEKNKGAFLNGKPIHVSKIDHIGRALLGFGNPRYIDDKEKLLKLIEICAAGRNWEVTYSMTLLAQGKIDLIYDGRGFIWDNAAYKIIIEEAGGKFTKLDGSPWDYYGHGGLVTNGLLHDVVLSILNK